MQHLRLRAPFASAGRGGRLFGEGGEVAAGDARTAGYGRERGQRAERAPVSAAGLRLTADASRASSAVAAAARGAHVAARFDAAVAAALLAARAPVAHAMARFTIARSWRRNMNFGRRAAARSRQRSHRAHQIAAVRRRHLLPLRLRHPDGHARHVEEGAEGPPRERDARAPKVSNGWRSGGDCALGRAGLWLRVLHQPQSNGDLDDAYGGYCVFAEVADDASFAVVDAFSRAAIASKQKPSVAVKTAASRKIISNRGRQPAALPRASLSLPIVGGLTPAAARRATCRSARAARSGRRAPASPCRRRRAAPCRRSRRSRGAPRASPRRRRASPAASRGARAPF